MLIRDQGTIVVFTPQTDEDRSWINENCHTEGWQWVGRSFAVDHGCAQPLVNGIIQSGLNWECRP